MKYVKRFDNHEDYLDYLESDEFVTPNVSFCDQEVELHYTPYVPSHDYSKDYLTFEVVENNCSIALYQVGLSNNPVIIQYSTDNGNTWSEDLTASTSNLGAVLGTFNIGDKILVKGNNETWAQGIVDDNASTIDGILNGTASTFAFTTTSNVNVYGNIMSISLSDNFKTNTNETGISFCGLFGDIFNYQSNGQIKGNHIINAENLILPTSQSLTSSVPKKYEMLFAFSSYLTTPPQMLTFKNSQYKYCYRDMFNGCTSLAIAPELPATTLAEGCYDYMFYGCTSLASVPVLPATTLANNCYGFMFANCTSLTSAPELPATTLANNCYSYMFYGCTSLASAPVLPATTLATGCYSGMFEDCTSLTTAPELPATTLANNCYSYMFIGTSLISAPVLPATTLAAWCYSDMFEGCHSLTSAPVLPATTLAEGCYSGMFEDCTSLTTAPELPATTLVTDCYADMFFGCDGLNYIKAMFTTTPSDTYTENWVSGVASSGTFVKNSSASWNVTGNNGVPSGWTVETASE